MTTEIASALLAAETDLLRLRPIVLLDWYDGPLEGITELAHPVSFWHFRLLGERTCPEDCDDRIFLFAQVADVAVERIMALADSGCEKPLVWPFGEKADLPGIEAAVDRAIANAAAPTLLLQSATFREVKGIWGLTPH